LIWNETVKANCSLGSSKAASPSDLLSAQARSAKIYDLVRLGDTDQNRRRKLHRHDAFRPPETSLEVAAHQQDELTLHRDVAGEEGFASAFSLTNLSSVSASC
jgi:hypothetical protein